MLYKIYALLEEADIVVHYNGSHYDIPTLNREFLKEKMTPPAPFAEVDLLKTCRSRFRFLSNKLDYVIRFLGEDGKMQHKGMELWTGCMAGDGGSWKIMEQYNKRGVIVTERLYTKLRPWIQPHPNLGLFRVENDDNRPNCPNCREKALNARGKARNLTMKYQRYQCMGCGKWTRVRLSDGDKETKKNILVGIK